MESHYKEQKKNTYILYNIINKKWFIKGKKYTKKNKKNMVVGIEPTDEKKEYTEKSHFIKK